MTNHVITMVSEVQATGVVFGIGEVLHADGGPRLRFNAQYEDVYAKVGNFGPISERVLIKTFEPEPVEAFSAPTA